MACCISRLKEASSTLISTTSSSLSLSFILPWKQSSLYTATYLTQLCPYLGRFWRSFPAQFHRQQGEDGEHTPNTAYKLHLFRAVPREGKPRPPAATILILVSLHRKFKGWHLTRMLSRLAGKIVRQISCCNICSRSSPASSRERFSCWSLQDACWS